MSRLRALLHVPDPSKCNTQQPTALHVVPPPATCNATAQQPLLQVASPGKRNTQQTPDIQRVGVFEFTPPGNPANDAEAVAERAAIMAVENRWDDARAVQEARWQADRERCWRAFLRNAGRILAAPEGERSELLTIYAAEASARYGDCTGADMAASLRGWVNDRAVH